MAKVWDWIQNNRIARHAGRWARKRRLRAAKEMAARTSWYPTMTAVQDEIARSNPHPHYIEAYRDEEIWYWVNVPGWLAKLRADGMQVQRVLDVGGAYGTLALYCKKLFGCEVFMTDFADSFLSRTLREAVPIHFAVNNLELDELPWGHRFDIVLFTEVLEHLNFNPRASLLKLRNALRDEGKLFLSTPDAAEWGKTTRYYEKLAEMPDPKPGQPVIDDHVWQYGKKELVTLLEECGFHIDELAYSPGTPNRHFNLQLGRV